MSIDNNTFPSISKIPLQPSTHTESTSEHSTAQPSTAQPSTVHFTTVTTSRAPLKETTIPTEKLSIPSSAAPEIVKTQALPVKHVERDKKFSKLIINMNSFLEPEVNYTIEVKFSGTILNNLIGLYKANYKTSDGRIR